MSGDTEDRAQQRKHIESLTRAYGVTLAPANIILAVHIRRNLPDVLSSKAASGNLIGRYSGPSHRSSKPIIKQISYVYSTISF